MIVTERKFGTWEMFKKIRQFQKILIFFICKVLTMANILRIQKKKKIFDGAEQ